MKAIIVLGIFLICMGCSSQNTKYTNIYFEQLNSFPDSLTYHFPKTFDEKKSFYNIIFPTAGHYNGFFGIRFIMRTDSTNEDVLTNNAFLSDSNSCVNFMIKKELLNFLSRNKKNLGSNSDEIISDFKYYYLKHGSDIIYKEQNEISLLNNCNSHGYSCGFAVNTKNKFKYYWLIFW